MTKTFNVKITLSDGQYEALQAIYRLEDTTLEQYCSDAILSALYAFLADYAVPYSTKYNRLEAMIEG